MKFTQLFLISLIVVFVAAIKADATTTTSVQGFVCNSSDPHGATAKFVNYKGALQLYLSLSDNSYDQAGALLGDVTAIPSTLSFVVTPVTNINDDAIFLVVYFKYNGNLYSSQYMNPQIVQHGATYTYTFSSGKADPPIPPGSRVVWGWGELRKQGEEGFAPWPARQRLSLCSPIRAGEERGITT